MSKRRAERARHDERVAGRNVTINRRMREESNDLDQCSACHSVIRAADVKHCGSCGWDGCKKCQPGSLCESCVKSISLRDDLARGCYEIDLDDDDLGDTHEDRTDPTCEECDDVAAEIGRAPANWDRFSDEMY